MESALKWLEIGLTFTL